MAASNPARPGFSACIDSLLSLHLESVLTKGGCCLYVKHQLERESWQCEESMTKRVAQEGRLGASNIRLLTGRWHAVSLQDVQGG